MDLLIWFDMLFSIETMFLEWTDIRISLVIAFAIDILKCV